MDLTRVLRSLVAPLKWLQGYLAQLGAPIQTAPAVVPSVKQPMPAAVNPPTYLWDTQEHARHSIRVICDETGLGSTKDILVNGEYYSEKDVLTACIYQESEFWNILPDGTPTKCVNPHSTDWGICQINDTPGWYIGPPPLPFASVQYLLAHPDMAVRFMAQMSKQGRLKKWVSYSSGAYKKWLPYVSTPVPASGHYA